VLGRSQRSLLNGIESQDTIKVLARASGGGAVLVGPWMLGLSVAIPTDHPLASGGPVNTYRWLGEVIAYALSQIGVDAWAISPAALLTHRAENSAPGLDWACFGGLSPWEVLVGNRKIAGLAQVRRRQGILLVAGVLMQEPPWQPLTRCIGKQAMDARRLSEITTNCTEYCPEMPADQIAVRLTAHLNREIEAALTVKSASPLEA
jgi:lipoate-protein ligase A